MNAGTILITHIVHLIYQNKYGQQISVYNNNFILLRAENELGEDKFNISLTSPR